MPKTDLNLVYKTCYRASSSRPALALVPDLNTLVVAGEGRTDSPGFLEAVRALTAVVYTLKLQLRRAYGRSDAPDMPLEVVWTLDRETQQVSWEMLIAQPDEVTPESFQLARAEAAEHSEPPALKRMRLERRPEETCVQMLHLGAQARVPETLAHVRAFGSSRGLLLRADAHEIYLNDPSTTRPENMRTLLRLAVLSARSAGN